MLFLLRKIRRKLMDAKKFTSYLLYAVGEIILVVIGILIAVSLNNWNTQKKMNELEVRYLSDIIKDLKLDSLYLASAMEKSDFQVSSKQRLIDYWRGEEITEDSLFIFFQSQWVHTYAFNPASTTLEEMKSSGTIGAIQNETLRRKILELDNQYDQYIEQGEGIYGGMQKGTWEALYQIVPNLYAKQISVDYRPDTKAALKIPEIQSRLQGNHVITFNRAIHQIVEANADCLAAVREEHQKLSKD